MTATNGRYVTPHAESPHYHLGRLSMAVAVSPRHPDTAREALEEFLKSPLPSTKLRKMLMEELRRK